MTTTALVTGGSGFVGRHLVARLVHDGVDVHTVRRAGSQRVVELAPGVNVHAFEDPSSSVRQLVAEVRPDVVYHLATFFAAQHDPRQLGAMIDANVTLGTAVAQGAADAGARLVHATSAWQHYGGAEYEPVSLYAATKQAFVDVLRYFVSIEGLDAREVLLFDTYGPDDDRGKLVSTLLQRARTGEPIEMSSGLQLVDLTYIDDVVSALLAAASGPAPQPRLAAHAGQPRTIRELVGVIEEVTGRTVDVRWGARPDRPREMTEPWPVASDDIGWRPSTSLHDGLAATWASLAGEDA